MRIFRILTFSALFAAFTLTASALNYQVNYTDTAPAIDGAVDAVWTSASAEMTGFVSSTNVALVSTEQTHVRLLWDSQKLYVLYEADDSSIVASATANDTGFDFTTPQDAVEIILDPALVQSGTGAANKSYRICVNPAANAYTYTEAGLTQTGWNLGTASQVVFASSGTNWKVEMAIAWTDLNSVLTNSPGPVIAAPGRNSIWAAQFARFHGGTPANNTVASKWHPVSGAAAATRPIGTISFAGGPTPVAKTFDDLTPVYSTSFEPPLFPADTVLSGTQEWVGGSAPEFIDIFKTTTTLVRTGVQSVGVLATTQGKTLLSPPIYPVSERTHVMQYAINMPSDVGNNYRHVLYVNGAYSDGTTRTLCQIWMYGSSSSTGGNTIRLDSFHLASETSATQYYFPGILAFNDWSYITVRADGSANSYQAWYNDIPLIYPGTTGRYPVRSRSLFEYMNQANIYNKTYGTLPFYLDDFAMYSAPTPNAAKDWQLLE